MANLIGVLSSPLDDYPGIKVPEKINPKLRAVMFID